MGSSSSWLEFREVFVDRRPDLMRRRLKVVVWNNQPAPYVVDWYNAISALDRFDFEAWFDVERESDRQWDVNPDGWRFRHRYVPTTRIWPTLLGAPVGLLRHVRPDVFVQNLDYARHALGACAGRVYSRRVAIAAEPSPGIHKARLLREAVKHVVLRGVDGAAVSGPDASEWVGHYGLPTERTWVTHEGVDTQHFARFRHVPASDRASLRAELGLRGATFIYVGRLEVEKGLLILLEACRKLARSNLAFSLLIVGSGSLAEVVRRFAEATVGVTFVGHKTRSELGRLYSLADALVFPTLGDSHGMVIEEAMAAGVPVIATTAVGNIDYRIRSGWNGCVVRANSSDDLAEAMRTFTTLSRERREAMRVASTVHAESVTPAVYARDFARFIDELVVFPVRHTGAVRMMKLANVVTAAAWPLLSRNWNQ